MFVKNKILLIALSVAGVLILWVNSTSWFRVKLAALYEKNGNIEMAINVYRKIIVKSDVSRGNTKAALFSHLSLGSLYADLNCDNLAISEFKKALKIDSCADVKLLGNRGTRCEKRIRLFLIALIETGWWNRAQELCKTANSLYPNTAYPSRYITLISYLKHKASSAKLREGTKRCFDIGEAYIDKGLYDEARGFFTKRIMEYAMPLEVLRYLDKKYGSQSNEKLKKKVWGKNIYVVLVDFEGFSPRFYRWMGTAVPKVHRHMVTVAARWDGKRAEFFDLQYDRGDWDYWAVKTDIPLQRDSPIFGVRLSMASAGHFAGHLKLNIVYSDTASETSGILQIDEEKDVGNGVEVRQINDIFTQAVKTATKCNPPLPMKTMKIDRIVVDTAGNSNRFYIGNIELCLLN